MKKLMVLSVLSVILLSGCVGSSNEECVYCGRSPSKVYNANGNKTYVCENCSSECFFCGDKATKKFTNISGAMTFACKDCYDSLPQ